MDKTTAEPTSKVATSNSLEKGLGGLESADVWGDQDDVSIIASLRGYYVLRRDFNARFGYWRKCLTKNFAANE